MAAYLSRLHHIALHVGNVDKTTFDLLTKFKFNLFAVRRTRESRQYALRKGSAVFVVNERLNRTFTLNEGAAWSPRHSSVTPQTLNDDSRFLYGVQDNSCVDTACNVCFEVEDVESVFNSLYKQGCDFLVPPTSVVDDNGRVTYSVVKSIVGNVCHTLVDRTKYKGEFLPGFQDVNVDSAVSTDGESSCSVCHFDHITYACPRKSTPEVMRWYEKNFGFKRFFIDRNEDVNEGYVIDQDGIGLRLTAMEYWKCSELEVSLPFKNKRDPDCKFVVAESLPYQGSNQVDSFLEQHGGAGIQHVGLYTPDIVSSVDTLAEAGVQFFSPPPTYYTQVGKLQEIEDAGHDPRLLSQHGILLDSDVRQNDSDNHLTASRNKRYLLQVFTRPIFTEDTFFLELIERRGAMGFGEGNIRALWRSVQAYMEGGDRERQALVSGATTADSSRH
ncbi:4-hydroxyphenylpyruvate dioxygenase-like protein isoform X1 [Paramormyrops kingsleyae]|uniref:4-hydroxyphenylpyruvate dioxygenase n=2 Tax=Paramormyrops kingsleyae TaxID=1676925 RepID=A0A3B3RGV3_9TELE|nr:4-hydroxyphenylpyruvate dioxygenase-like protein isoform X1 [Paramormyrops kingsleyae]